MILEEETFKKFGYYPRDLKPKSNRRILAQCNECGKIRILRKTGYSDLCRTCVCKGISFSNEHKQKLSEAQKGKKLSEETKQKISKTKKGTSLSKETKQKISEARKGMHFSEEYKQKISDNHADFRGENHPNWQGGISFEPYCIKFDKKFKEQVREYWDRRCVVCNKSETENGKRLSVHHVNYDKETCCNDSIPLFVALCDSCHGKVHYNREYWENKFKNIIYLKNKNGKCFYTKEEMNDRK